MMEAPKVIYWFVMSEGTDYEESSYTEDEAPGNSEISHITPFVPKSDYDEVVNEAREIISGILYSKSGAILDEALGYAQKFLEKHKEG